MPTHREIELASLARLLATSKISFMMICDLRSKITGDDFDVMVKNYNEMIQEEAKKLLYDFFSNNELSDINVDDLLK